jgi:hypothetical protein
VQCYRRLGYILIAEAIANPIHGALLSIALTLHNLPGQRMLSIGLSSRDLTGAIMGGIVLVISWVMDEGRKLEEEQTLTI